MTIKQAQERNSKIMQFRGMYNRIYNCIPDDILEKLDNNDINILKLANEIYKDVINLMNESAGCKHIMKLKELENIAYQIATGCTTTKTLNVKQWNKCNIDKILWEPLENLGTDFTEDLVSNIATTIISKFKHLCSDYNE